MSARDHSDLIRATGAEVRRLRLARGWKLRHLAEATGITVSGLSRLETGEGAAIESLEAVAAALGRKLSIAFIDRPEADYEGGAVG